MSGSVDIDITIVELDHVQNVFKPSIFVNIVTPKSNCTLGVVYRSPNCSMEESEALNSQISEAVKYSQKAGGDLMIIGDFNYPEIDWCKETCSQAATYQKAASFLENTHMNNLTQIINKPTHYRCLQTPTLIDLLLVNESDPVSNICHLPPFGMSHHSVISFDLKVNITPSKGKGV